MKNIFLLLLILLPCTMFAQRKGKQLDQQQSDENTEIKQYESSKGSSFKDKLYFGGNLGGGFSSNNSYFLIQPIVGYKVSDNFSVGVDPIYIYASQTYTFNNGVNTINKKFATSVIGPGVFARYNVIENIFAYTEYQGISYTTPVYDASKADWVDKDFWNNNLYVGGGYSTGGNGNGGAYFMLLYNLLYDANRTFYGRPYDVRIGFLF